LVLRSRWIIDKEEVQAKKGIVTSAIPQAAEAGLKMLKRGGNAIDAGVAIGFCNTVLEPYMAALGGLGFMLVHVKDDDKTVAFDFNARAPSGASPEMYNVIGASPAGGTRIFEVENAENSMGAKAVTVPTTCAGFCLAHELYGILPREDVVAPAIHLAINGFQANWDAALYLARIMPEVKMHPYIEENWYPGGFPITAGTLVKQTDFGKLLKNIARDGAKAVYEGKVADLIEEEILLNGGILTKEDLGKYEPGVYEPLTVSYRDYTIAAVPTPSGGVTALEAFSVLKNFDLQSLGHNSVEYLHTLIESTRHAFADRYFYLGDWEYANVPLEGMLSEAYGAEIAETIRKDKTLMDSSLDSEPWIHYMEKAVHDPWRYDSKNRPRKISNPVSTASEEGTTHFNVVDSDRNVVSCTHTPGFRPGIVPAGTGFYLTSGMGWFIPKPGYPNSVQGWKRPVMNMAPLMVLKDGEPILTQGSPGARRIIKRNIQVVLNILEFNQGAQEAITNPTIDASGRETLIDSRVPMKVIKGLKELGHRITVVEEGPGMWHFARPSGILIDNEKGVLRGGVDVFRPAIALGL
jgi:gamma-glutamyltranspeptidase/glutathione hydrolase